MIKQRPSADFRVRHGSRYYRKFVGRRFGFVIVTGLVLVKQRDQNRLCFLYRCDCGNERSTIPPNILSGRTQSCGCKRGELAKTSRRLSIPDPPSITHRSTYASWSGMLRRCSIKGTRREQMYYYLRGIRVCKRWHRFTNFLADMGDRPPGKTIDRKNNDGDYKPSNCRWATPYQQAHNNRHVVKDALEFRSISRQRRYQIRRTREGRCGYCGKPARPNYRLCDYHIQQANKRYVPVQ
jgi:hypothetical protein